MNFLSIDTSGKYSVLAIFDEKKNIFGERRLFEKGRVDGLSDFIAEALKKSRMKIADIGCFGVGVGPGSFTGLRIGLSAVKGFGYALDVPVVSFSSLDAIAYNPACADVSNLCVIVDARRGNVYCRFYSKHKNAFKRDSADELISLKDLFARCKSSAVFCGDAAALHAKEIEEKFGTGSILPEDAWFPTPSSITRLTLEAVAAGGSKNCFQLTAAYLYEQDCQVSSAARPEVFKPVANPRQAKNKKIHP